MNRDAIVLATPGELALQRVAGVPLVKRALIVLSRAGVTRAVVIGDALVSSVLAGDKDLAATGLAIEVRAAGELAALPAGAIIARADHVYDVNIAKLAVATAAPASGRIALVAGDAEVGLGVGTHDGKVTSRVQIPDGAVWHRADNPAQRRAAEDLLFRSLVKRTDGPVSRYLNRPMSLFVTRRLVNTDITPNQMTIVANIIGALGVWFVFQATWTTVAIGGALVHLQSVLDGCDGEMARLKFKSSRVGEWLDNVLDDQVNIGYGIALGYAAGALSGHEIFRWLGLGAGIAFFLHNAVFYWQLAFVHRSGNPFNFRWWFEKPGVDVTAMLAAPTMLNKLGAALRSLIRRDLFLFAFMVLCIVRLPQIAVLWYASVAASQFVVMTLHVLNGGARRAGVR